MQLDPAKLWEGGAQPPRELDPADVKNDGAMVALQKKVCAVLKAWLPLAPAFAQKKPGVCTWEDQFTIRRDVETALQAVGISMVVGIHSAARQSALKNAVTLSPITFTVSIAEEPTTNRGQRGSRVTCTKCAELVILALSGLPLANGLAEFTGMTSSADEEYGWQLKTLSFTTSLLVAPDPNPEAGDQRSEVSDPISDHPISDQSC